MDMKYLVAKLSRINSMLENIESSSDYNGCANSIREAQLVIQQMTEDLSKMDYKYTISEQIGKIIMFLTELFALLGRLKDYFNFYQQPYLLWNLYWFYNTNIINFIFKHPQYCYCNNDQLWRYFLLRKSKELSFVKNKTLYGSVADNLRQ